MAGGLANDCFVRSFVTDDALDDAGYVMQVLMNGGAGKIQKAVPTGTEIGVAYASTIDPISGDAEDGVAVPVLLARPGLVVYLQLVSDNQAIVIHDPLCITSDSGQAGEVDLHDGGTEDNTTIALALEAKDENAGGVILAVLTANIGTAL